MSSHLRAHKERAQPKARERWGILEKHKDYSLRSKDYREKQRRLKILKEKAADRNPDEFHFAMMSGRTRDGGVKVADRGNQVLGQDTVRLLKTQDAGYLRTVAQQTRKKKENLAQTFVLSGDSTAHGVFSHSDGKEGHTHVTFLGLEDDQTDCGLAPQSKAKMLAMPDSAQRIGVDRLDYLSGISDDGASTVDKRENMEAPSDLSSLQEKRAAHKQQKRRQKAKENLLEALQEREKSVKEAQRELDLQRAKMSRKVGPIVVYTKRGKKFKIKERKR